MPFWICKLLLVLGAIPPATLAFKFVNPASHGGQTGFAQNTVYAEKSIVEVQWTVADTNQDATVALFQVDITKTQATDEFPETIGDLEYIAEGQDYDRTSRRWIVITNKDLTTSPVFVMMLFETGKSDANDTTIYFNISSADSTSTSTTASASATTATSLSTSSSVSSPTTSAITSGVSSDSSAALPTSAQIGIGVGIPAAAIAGVLATWLAFRRWKAHNQPGLGGQSRGDEAMGGVQSQEDKNTGFDRSTISTSRPISDTLAYGPASNAPVYGPASNAPTYGPASNAPVYGPASNAPTYGPASNAPTYGPASNAPVYGPTSSTPVYEASSNERIAPSELYAPNTTR